MRTLRHHLILFDAECPMCKLYTGAFTHTGMLDANGRLAYQEILADPGQTAATCPLIDRQRAVDEIALVDTTTGEVTYGIDSLFAVIGHAYPLFRPLFSLRSFRWAMRKLYAFISYNRKVIIPAPGPVLEPTAPVASPQPTFRLRYRVAWLIFSTAVAASILTPYSRLLSGVFPAGAPYREFLVCTGQLFYQGFVVSLIAPAKRWEYLGHMTTISLAGAIALLPALAVSTLTNLPAWIAAAWFMIVVALMLVEHLRRTRLLGLDATLTISWVAYRLAVLLLILL